MDLEIPAEMYLDVSLDEDHIRMIKGLPLVTVVEREGRVNIYKIKDFNSYWVEYRKKNEQFGITLKETEELCAKYGTPITEDEFFKSKIFPAFLRSRPDGNYNEYRALFEE